MAFQIDVEIQSILPSELVKHPENMGSSTEKKFKRQVLRDLLTRGLTEVVVASPVNSEAGIRAPDGEPHHIKSESPSK